MREHPDHHDAELLLRLYELRREGKLREARAWMATAFRAESLEEYFKKYPFGTPENERIRMVMSYWDMAASVVNHGLIKEEFFFENTAEFWGLWARVQHLAAGIREYRKNPYLWKNIEMLSERYEKWMEKRAPGHLESIREQVIKAPAKG
jgi:hypothetical protein